MSMSRSRMIWDEKRVNVPASEAWKVYSTLELAKIVEEALPDLITKIKVVHGDGGAGTILELFFQESSGFKSYKEKFTVVDHEKRVKVAEVVEGGYLDLGFSLYQIRLEVIQVDDTHCLTRSTIEYQLKQDQDVDAAAALVSIQPLTTIMQLCAHRLEQTYNNNNV